jgi:hypothetical protein
MVVGTQATAGTPTTAGTTTKAAGTPGKAETIATVGIQEKPVAALTSATADFGWEFPTKK